MNGLRGFASLVAALLLAGCISILPKETPSPLFRFGTEPPPAPQGVAAGTRRTVQILPLSFDHAAASDRILAVTGNSVAHIRGGRWVSSARNLFETAIARAFNVEGTGVRLVTWGEAVSPEYFLKVNVTTFEARYDHGQSAAPTVVVEMRATLSKPTNRSMAGEKTFQASATASENRVGAIAAAFDQAVSKVLGDMVSWVAAGGSPG
jgi:cholesterol transport system auxiliary component